MDPTTIFVIVATLSAVGLLAYMELTSRKRKPVRIVPTGPRSIKAPRRLKRH